MSATVCPSVTFNSALSRTNSVYVPAGRVPAGGTASESCCGLAAPGVKVTPPAAAVE